MKKWQENEFYTHHFYDDENGRVIGITHKLGTQNTLYIAKIYDNRNNEILLGQYINCEYSKKAVELYWNIQDRTLLESE